MKKKKKKKKKKSKNSSERAFEPSGLGISLHFLY